MKRATLLDKAAGLGRTLCASAYWHDGRCNWVGRSARESADPRVPLTPTVAALGPELYSGTAGIAVFLAQLQARVHADEFRDTALGAIRQSLWRSADLPVLVSRSFYSGAVGIAYAAARVGLLLDEPAIVAEGLALAQRTVAARDGDHLLDVIGGHAGAIAPLFWLAALPGGEGLEAAAIAYAGELADAAMRDGGVWRWDNDRACGAGVGSVPLCGLAHGASGMGLALIECGVRCRRREWIDGGLAAFRYEDQLFDQERGNWPDLREHRTSGGEEPRGARAFMVAWCHGAAGIGLARLRALRLLPGRRQRIEPGVRRALRATAAMLKALPDEADASPCHGRAGLAETLLLRVGGPARSEVRGGRVEAMGNGRSPRRRGLAVRGRIRTQQSVADARLRRHRVQPPARRPPQANPFAPRDRGV